MLLNSRGRSSRFFFSALLVICGSPLDSLAAKDLPLRMVIGTHVVCRARPARSAAATHAFRLGDIVLAAKETHADGATWYFDPNDVTSRSTCWLYGSMTTAFERSDPAPALLAMVDHLLQRKDHVTFEESVEADNLLTSDRSYSHSASTYAQTVVASGLLQFWRLSLIDRAVAGRDAGRDAVASNPLKAAWMASHRDLVRYFEPGARWYLGAEPYWDVYERFKDATWADELAWTAAQHTRPTDECYSDCVLQVRIIDGPLQYWTRLPNGRAIAIALERATSMAKYAAEMACYGRDAARAERESQSPVPRPLLEQIRNSLANVTAPEKSALLGYLNDAERKCSAPR